MAGLLAARVLADRYDRVVVIERDRMPAGAERRRGVPQAHHFHTVLPRGAEILESLFPGLTGDLVAAGAHQPNLLLDARLVLAGHELARADTGNTIQLTRPLLESEVRDRVAAIDNVKIVDGCEAVGLRFDGDRVVGVRVNHLRHHEAGLIDADLVVDATGRACRSATWLSEAGFPAPVEERIAADIVYVSRLLRIPVDVQPADQLTLVGPVPGRTRAFALAAQEGDRWMLTVAGMAGDHPPVDEAELVEFVASSAPPDVHLAIKAGEPAGEPLRHRFPASVWRHYERLRRFPAGLLVVGDSICSFNPVYGQGMTVAALEAEALRQCVLVGDDRLARRFFRRAAKIVAPAWQLNAGGDLALPEIEGHRSLALRVINRYVARLQRVAEHDEAVAGAFMQVSGLRQPPTRLMSPRILARVLTGGAAARVTRR